MSLHILHDYASHMHLFGLDLFRCLIIYGDEKRGGGVPSEVIYFQDEIFFLLILLS